MKFKQGCLFLAAAVSLITCLVLSWFAWRYESLDDDAENIVLTPEVPDITYRTMDGIPQQLDLHLPATRDAGVLPLPASARRRLDGQ